VADAGAQPRARVPAPDGPGPARLVIPGLPFRARRNPTRGGLLTPGSSPHRGEGRKTKPTTMIAWTLAKKDLRSLLRDPKAAVILLVMPLLFILVLGVSLG